MEDLGFISIRSNAHQGKDTCIILADPFVECLSSLLDSIKSIYDIGNDLQNMILGDVMDSEDVASESSNVSSNSNREETQIKVGNPETQDLGENCDDPLKSEPEEKDELCNKFEQNMENEKSVTIIASFEFFNQNCQLCNIQFSSDSELSEHFYQTHEPVSVDTTNGKPEYQCRTCRKQFMQYPAAVRHCRVRSSEPYQCPHCDTTISVSNNVARHRKRCSGEKSFFCSKCRKIVKHTKLETHSLTCNVRKKHHVKHTPVTEEGQTYICCTFCDFESIYTNIMKKHMTTSHSKNPDKFNCEKCNRKFLSKSGLKKHKANIHSHIKMSGVFID